MFLLKTDRRVVACVLAGAGTSLHFPIVRIPIQAYDASWKERWFFWAWFGGAVEMGEGRGGHVRDGVQSLFLSFFLGGQVVSVEGVLHGEYLDCEGLGVVREEVVLSLTEWVQCV